MLHLAGDQKSLFNPRSTTEKRTSFDLLENWEGVGRRGSQEDWWRSIPTCIWWTLWRERNERGHDGIANSSHNIEMRSLSLLYFWCKQDIVGEIDSLVDFIGQL
ncbi:hypothetical protein H5410_022553 [Solanum commersonii]|uniref:Uncharacterized protein n=1 Tax=Solanum commersonii TaxID=4109 RepID=A0A9J5ZHI2_SOLCO|nr:hypothetical protein H5410_022553 [Solanum commersonii]